METCMKKIILGISSSISLYKACEIVRALQKRELAVQVIMTSNASKLISPRLFRALTGHEVYVDIFSETSTDRIAHIDLAGEAALFLIAPATANVIGKMAHGIADDFLTTFYLAATCPVLVAPAMNEKMYLHARTQANIEILKADGVQIILPDKGRLACGDEGWGRLAQTEAIVAQSLRSLALSNSLKGKTILVTAGPTREAWDPVRYLTNRSSGKMGYALAEEAVRRGAEVFLISGPTSLSVPASLRHFFQVETALEMESVVKKYAEKSDVVIMAAAVADFTFSAQAEQKIKKAEDDLVLKLIRTPDILAGLGRRKNHKILVGFAAESENLEKNARTKLKTKNLDLIVANDITQSDAGFGSDYNRVFLEMRDGRTVQTKKMSKKELSCVILNEIEGILAREKKTDNR